MKKHLLLGLLLIGLNCFAQGTMQWQGEPGDGYTNTSLPSTTEKEYNYLTKGLKIQRESGLDIVDGYEIQEIGNITVLVNSKHSFAFANFIEKKTNDLKGISVIIKSKTIAGGITYVCIPVNSLQCFTNYQNYIKQFPLDLAKAYVIALSEQFWNVDRAIINKNKNLK